MRISAGALALFLTATWMLPAQSSGSKATNPKGIAASKKSVPAPVDPKPETFLAPAEKPLGEKLTYDVEWRLIRAGTVVIDSQQSRANLLIDSGGLVSSLFKVHDTYSAQWEEPFCATTTVMDSLEGKRHREARVTYDRNQNRATFVERDLLKDSVVHSNEVEIPHCVQDVATALLRLRTIALEPGQSVQLPVSDGRRSAAVKIDAQERETVKTPLGTYKAVRFEANMMNGVVYTRKGTVQIWLSEDTRRLPVQIRLRMPFPVGTVTLQLEKESRPIP